MNNSNTYIGSLIRFINTHDDWRERLSNAPYNILIKNDEKHIDYYMFKYVMFLSDFNYDEVKASRGCVLEIIDNKVKGIVCHAFDKFFNYGEPHQDNIDWSTAVVTEKIDGQLIKISRYKDEILYFTNGAFGLNTEITGDVPYEKLVKSLIDKNTLNNIPEGWTFMFEFISPYNRIICQYDTPKLYLLGGRDNDDKEWTALDIKNEFGLSYDIPQRFDLHDIEAVKNELSKWNGMEQEGVVICDANFKRIKIKCDDYLKIKYYIGSNIKMTDDKLFHAIICNEIDDLIAFDNSIIDNANHIKDEIQKYQHLTDKLSIYAKQKFNALNKNRKEFAIFACNTNNILLKEWFRLLDNKYKIISKMTYAEFQNELHNVEKAYRLFCN